jgi:hypothetical protein
MIVSKKNHINKNTCKIIQFDKKTVHYDITNFMTAYDRQAEEDKEFVAMTLFGFFTRQLLEEGIPKNVMEEHFQFLNHQYKAELVHTLNSKISNL